MVFSPLPILGSRVSRRRPRPRSLPPRRGPRSRPLLGPVVRAEAQRDRPDLHDPVHPVGMLHRVHDDHQPESGVSDGSELLDAEVAAHALEVSTSRKGVHVLWETEYRRPGLQRSLDFVVMMLDAFAASRALTESVDFDDSITENRIRPLSDAPKTAGDGTAPGSSFQVQSVRINQAGRWPPPRGASTPTGRENTGYLAPGRQRRLVNPADEEFRIRSPGAPSGQPFGAAGAVTVPTAMPPRETRPSRQNRAMARRARAGSGLLHSCVECADRRVLAIDGSGTAMTHGHGVR